MWTQRIQGAIAGLLLVLVPGYYLSPTIVVRIWLLIFCAIALYGAWWIWWVMPKRQISQLRFTIRDAKTRADVEDNFRKTFGQLLAGITVLIGAGIAYFQFIQQQQSAHDLLISNQVSKGFEQLGSQQLMVRLGGIYALEGVMNASDKYYRPVLEALCAFIRDTTKEKRIGDGPPTTDVQAALTVVWRREFHKGAYGIVNLSNAHLSNAHLDEVSGGPNFFDMSYSEMFELLKIDVPKFGVDLRGALMRGVDLRGTNLRIAFMVEADLTGADLRAANLTFANLRYANLTGADLRAANLMSANLHSADLSRADLRAANLAFANLDDANLAGTNLEGAKLKGASLVRANLKGANLTQGQLRDVGCATGADLPLALTPPPCE